MPTKKPSNELVDDDSVRADESASDDSAADNQHHEDTEGCDAEVGPEAEDNDATPRRRWRWRLTVIALAAFVVAVTAGAGWLGWQYRSQRDIAISSQQALDAAKNYAVVLTSIDPSAIDRNFTDVLNGATGEFKDMYAKSSNQLRQLLLDNKATAHGTVIEAGIKSATHDKVEVLLFVDQAVTNSAVPEPRIDRSRVTMTMERIDGRWLASKVELP